ncbi:MAG: aminotransferase class I/II-fold pyridoxal phosphate-dependent enzyme [Planctomycetota bacterium]
MTTAARPRSFGGCDYLGLARHGRVLEAAVEALRRQGLGLGASPATTGLREEHRELERELAAFLGCEEAALLPSGAVANLAAAGALAAAAGEASTGDPPSAWVDPRAHPSLRRALRAAGFAAARSPSGARVCAVDGVYPSLGQAPDLHALGRELGPGGALLVDDAHGFGVLGPEGRGSVAAQPGASDAPVLQTLPFSKALGGGGAAVAGPAALIEHVRNGDAYVGSTALAPALTAGARAALRVLREEPEHLARLHSHVEVVHGALRRAGLAAPALAFPAFALHPREGDSSAALRARLLADGVDVPLIRYPGGAADGWLRLALSAAHSDDDVRLLAEALERHLAH